MAIIPKIGKKSRKVRLAIGLIYVFLTAGTITMLYPFLIMLSGSVKGLADIEQMDPVARVFYSEPMQFARYQEDRYGTLSTLSAAYSAELTKGTDAVVPKGGPGELKSYQTFLKQQMKSFPDHFYIVQEMTSSQKILPRNFRMLKDEIRRECGSLEAYNRRYTSALSSWNQFAGVMDVPFTKEFCYERSALFDRYLEFKRSRPDSDKVVLNLDGYYLITQKTFPEVREGKVKPVPVLAVRCPKGAERLVWEEFVKHRLNCLFIGLDSKGLALFHAYLKSKYPGGVAQMNKINDTSYASFGAVKAGNDELRNSAMFTLYTDFITNVCPAERMVLDTPGTRYRAFVGFAGAVPPFVEQDHAVFMTVRKTYLGEIFTRNYRNVVEYVAVYGRAIVNTLIFIGLSIVAALIVNPLAAYALSRFNLKHTYAILMFFLGTMAFPSAVTMIPNFLLLKNLHLLNSFWALILPGVANGYSIFILKGFFDSIPKEIYESAQIDGASEWTMFWRFTMALSKPILALITLGAFTAAYSAFMFALIICPDERMWTLTVWLYQLQQGAHQSVVYAALVLAALPTLLMFVLAQNTIMKGIVVPVEK